MDGIHLTQPDPATFGWQVVVCDPYALSGKSIAHMIRRLAWHLDTPWIVISDIDPLLPPLYYEGAAQLWSAAEVAQRVEKYAQLDWGDFGFYSSQEVAKTAVQWANRSPSRRGWRWYAIWISSASLLMRCVDDYYFYFYGRSRGLYRWMVEGLFPSEHKWGRICQLDFPA